MSKVKDVDKNNINLCDGYPMRSFYGLQMIRVLVATAIREAAAGADGDALLTLMDATCRRATAPPAPPDGLCLVDVGYTEFDRKNCLIP